MSKQDISEEQYAEYLARGFIIENKFCDRGNQTSCNGGMGTYATLLNMRLSTTLQLGNSFKEMAYWTICGASEKHGGKCSHNVSVQEIEEMLTAMENMLQEK